ncbi:hypothetical protein LR48_Vigan08g026500 [Vigna angularis]|uniref:Uncharacterized protein n=1 Tax=Phaseolus angularis TaxID=3914 RepID=A0A0L9V350_PHAAN|nr:hypothetical protein LR48_Vigan08g026500 [Vigna angularis]
MNILYVGLSFEGNIPYEWTNDYFGLHARQIICNKMNANIAGSFVQVKRSFRIGVEVINSFDFVKNVDGHWVHKRNDALTFLDDYQPSPPQKDTSFVKLTEIMNEIRDL